MKITLLTSLALTIPVYLWLRGSLNYRDTHSSAVSYLTQLGNPYSSVIYDPQGKLSIDLGVIGTPETYLVTKSGDIIYKYSGELNKPVWDKYFARYFEQERM